MHPKQHNKVEKSKGRGPKKKSTPGCHIRINYRSSITPKGKEWRVVKDKRPLQYHSPPIFIAPRGRSRMTVFHELGMPGSVLRSGSTTRHFSRGGPFDREILKLLRLVSRGGGCRITLFHRVVSRCLGSISSTMRAIFPRLIRPKCLFLRADGASFPRDNDEVGCLLPMLFPKVCMDLKED